MNQLTIEGELNGFRKTFTDFGFIQGNHIVYWNEAYATEDKARFIRVVEAMVRYAIDNRLPIPFDRLILFLHKGNFDLHFRTVKAYTVWFYDTLTGLLTSPVNLTKPLKF